MTLLWILLGANLLLIAVSAYIERLTNQTKALTDELLAESRAIYADALEVQINVLTLLDHPVPQTMYEALFDARRSVEHS